MALRERSVDHEGVLVARADGGNGTGVLVLSGSSGRVERDRAALVASAGVSAALTYRWFGGAGQPAGIWEHPLESFAPAVELLAGQCDRVVLLGASKSAEAFLSYPSDDTAEPVGDPPAFSPVYAQSLRTAPADRVAAATIAVERFFGDVLLVAGGDDRVWPSVQFARAVRDRRQRLSLPTT